MAVSENVLVRDFYINVCGVPFKYIEQVSTDRVDSFMGRSDSKMSLITINADMTKEMKEKELEKKAFEYRKEIEEQTQNLAKRICELQSDLVREKSKNEKQLKKYDRGN